MAWRRSNQGAMNVNSGMLLPIEPSYRRQALIELDEARVRYEILSYLRYTLSGPAHQLPYRRGGAD